MAIPARRSPGRALVVVLVFVGVVVAFGLVLLRPEPVLGPPLLLIRADDTITATPANTTVPATFGPHCAQVRWLDRQRVLTMDADVDLAGASAVILQRYDPDTENVQWDGGDAVLARFLTTDAMWAVTSPVDSRVLATFDLTGTNVTADGVPHAPGDAWTMTFEYDALVDGLAVHIVEVIAFRNEGIVVSHIVPPPLCA